MKSKIYGYPSGGSSGGTAEAGTSLWVVITSEDWTYSNGEWGCVISDTMFHQNGYLYCAEPFDYLTIEHIGALEIYGYISDGEAVICIWDEEEQWNPTGMEFLITPSKVKGLEEFESVFTFDKFSQIAVALVDAEGNTHLCDDLGSKIMISEDASTTPEDIIWNVGNGDVTGTLEAADAKKGTFCLVPTSTTGTQAEGEYQRSAAGPYIVYATYEENDTVSWVRITPTQLDALHNHELIMNVDNSGVLSYSIGYNVDVPVYNGQIVNG